MKKIKLRSLYAGPRGIWQAGMVLVVGSDVRQAEADELVKGGYAVAIEDRTAITIETADVAPPETAMVQTSGRKAKGR